MKRTIRTSYTTSPRARLYKSLLPLARSPRTSFLRTLNRSPLSRHKLNATRTSILASRSYTRPALIWSAPRLKVRTRHRLLGLEGISDPANVGFYGPSVSNECTASRFGLQPVSLFWKCVGPLTHTNALNASTHRISTPPTPLLETLRVNSSDFLAFRGFRKGFNSRSHTASSWDLYHYNTNLSHSVQASGVSVYRPIRSASTSLRELNTPVRRDLLALGRRASLPVVSNLRTISQQRTLVSSTPQGVTYLFKHSPRLKTCRISLGLIACNMRLTRPLTNEVRLGARSAFVPLRQVQLYLSKLLIRRPISFQKYLSPILTPKAQYHASLNLVLKGRASTAPVQTLQPSQRMHTSLLLPRPQLRVHTHWLGSAEIVSVSTSPVSSTEFVRSPFFFLNTLKLFSSHLSTPSGERYHPDYLIFPRVNDIKSGIFNRLRQQKSDFSSIVDRFRNSSYGRSRNSLGTTLHRRPSPLPTQPRFTNMPLLSPQTPLWSLFRGATRLYENAPTVRRVRFKPGYTRLWKAARVDLREIFGINARYQYRLTPQIQARYFRARRLTSSTTVVTLSFLLATTRLTPDSSTAMSVTSQNLVYLNGLVCRNPATRLFLNDFVQLVVSVKYYILMRWLQSSFLAKRSRAHKVYFQKFRPAVFNRNIRIVRELPSWFLNLQFAYSDVPKYAEVDYFTLSAFIINDNFTSTQWFPSAAWAPDEIILNMYNWKYIT